MTEKLKTLLHERAASVHFETPDLDAMTRAGDHRMRRRRSLAVAGGVAAAAVLVAAVALIPGTEAPDSAEVTGHDGPAAPVTWVTDSTLHTTDGPDVDLGVPVRAYVRTSVGYVYCDRSGRIFAWRLGEVSAIGRTDPEDVLLVSDDETDQVGWVDDSGKRSSIVIHDQRASSTVRLDETSVPAMDAGPVALRAIDAGTVYWEGARGLVGLDLRSGETQVWEPGGRGGSVTDVKNGRFAFHTGQSTVVGTVPGEGVDLETAYGSVGVLSPDGRFYSSEGDEQAVFDTTTGEQVRLDLEQRFATGYEWLDGSTLAVLAAARPQMGATAQLVTCSVPDGACRTVVEDLGTFAELADHLTLPNGDSAG